MKTFAVWASAAVIYLVGFGATWAALSSWYPDEDCAVIAEAVTGTALEVEGVRVLTERCERANADRGLGRLVGSAAWPVVLPAQLGMRGDWGLPGGTGGGT